MTTYRITPDLRHIALRMKFLQPVSHHDPAQHDSSNRNLFNRAKCVIEREAVAVSTDVSHLLALFTVPERYASLYQELAEDEFLAVALLYEFMFAYSTADGVGLFSGAERYRRLEERAAQWAVRASSVFRWWGGLAKDLQVGLPIHGDDTLRVALFSVPAPVALRVLKTLAENSPSTVMLARVWREAVRDGEPLVRVQPKPQHYQTASVITLDVPAVSANSVRHEMVREPGALHLLAALGLVFEDLPAAVAAALYNAGDLSQASPEDAFKLARKIRRAYPLLGLLGASANGFLLGASNLEVRAWLIGHENRDALVRYGIEPQLSLFDLLDSAEHTRHTNRRVDGSPMPYGFETLAAGTELLVEFVLRPYATRLELGALMAALNTYAGADSTLFGQSARGYGLVATDWLAFPDGAESAAAEYEAYLADNMPTLRAGLLDGTLSTAKVVLA